METENKKIVVTAEELEELRAAHKALHDLIEKHNLPAVILILAPEEDGVNAIGTTRIDGPVHADILVRARAAGMALFEAAKLVAKSQEKMSVKDELRVMLAALSN